ncbi:prolyl oligopeptidase family serine peptidase [Acidomonas methanolica]|nr:DPP IV N-terminal domain-containing protein [Acidomonas methanolica]MBU2653720.1 prolyl oligopeptidase family serine peptidase [Acidomonas methanolica]
MPQDSMPPLSLRRLLAVGTLLLAAPAYSSSSPAAESCFSTLATTRNFSLGLPRAAVLTPDGRSVLFLRSFPRDTVLHLYRYDLTDGTTHELAAAGGDTPEHLSVEEKARRERARLSLSGITEFHAAPDGATLIAARGGQILRVPVADGAATPLPGSWTAPRLSPDGTRMAAVRDDDLYVVDLAGGATTRLTQGGSPDFTHGLAEFAAAEELERPDGAWWSPDGTTLLYEEADSRAVEKHYIANPATPQTPPIMFRYPRAGTNNARLRLGLVAAKGGETRWVDWDSTGFPYLGRVVWRKTGGLFLVVLNRAQTEERVLAVDPATGATRVVLTDTDPAWLNLTPVEHAGGLALPYALEDGRFLWAAQRGAHWQLELHRADGGIERVLTPQSLPYLALLDVDEAKGAAVIAADPSRIDTRILRLSLKDGAVTPLVTSPGRHLARFTKDLHGRFVDDANLADGTRAVTVRDAATGAVIATAPSVAEHRSFPVHAAFTRAGPLALDAVVIRPRNFTQGRRYPVILSVYGGPGVKLVNDTPATYAPEQCLADHGYIVVSMDGRGTPERDHDFERAIKNDLIDLPLQDQIDGLKSLGARIPEMDLSRAGVYGWSFGGYFTAMAVLRRPDVFATGVAGAPPVDFADYDTAYTERYLGTPQADPEGYRRSNVLTYAEHLSRPLLLLHGLTDDNVYFENTMKLTQALLRAGKPYDLMLLPGTHMLADPVLRARVDEARAAWFARVLHP